MKTKSANSNESFLNFLILPLLLSTFLLSAISIYYLLQSSWIWIKSGSWYVPSLWIVYNEIIGNYPPYTSYVGINKILYTLYFSSIHTASMYIVAIPGMLLAIAVIYYERSR